MVRIAVSGCTVLFSFLLLVPAHGQTVITPGATGTVRFLPEFNIGPELAPVGDSVQSTYFRTTSQNREFRRGFAEFDLPPLSNFFGATLIFRECRAITTFPLPPDVHELSYYLSVDMMIDGSDYGGATVGIGTFETDFNLENASFSFDVTSLVRQQQGGSLGLRFKLADDPTRTSFFFAGSQFCGIRIEVLTIEGAIANLIADIEQLDLPKGLETSLTSKLAAAQQAVASGHITAGCGILQAFINHTNAQSGSQPGKKISSGVAAQLVGAATALREALNCP